MTWTQNDLEPPLSGTVMGRVRADHPELTDAAFNALKVYPIPLTAAVGVKIHIRRPEGAEVLVREVERGDQGVKPGSWAMPLQVTDLGTKGKYIAEIEVSWPGNRPQTFGPVEFQVIREIA